MKKIIGLALLAASLVSCENKTEDLQITEYKSYFPLVAGKYISYKLDSTVYTRLGTQKEVHTYEIKFENDGFIKDNKGRDLMRIFAYLRKPGSTNWQPINTFGAQENNNGIEWVENNKRFIKLMSPVREGFTWKGNSYLETGSIDSDVSYLADWDYTYAEVGAAKQIGTFNLDNTITVLQKDESIGNLSDPKVYSEVNKAWEVYAKDIGLVYKYFEHTVFQPTPNPAFEDGSYTIELTMIDHN